MRRLIPSMGTSLRGVIETRTVENVMPKPEQRVTLAYDETRLPGQLRSRGCLVGGMRHRFWQQGPRVPR